MKSVVICDYVAIYVSLVVLDRLSYVIELVD